MRSDLRVLLHGVLSVFLFLSDEAVLDSIFLKFIRLTGHGRFVSLDTRGLHDDTIDWYVHTCLDLDDISDDDVVVLNLFFFSISKTNNYVVFITDSLEL